MIFNTATPEQTEAIGEKLGRAVINGCFIALYGGLGAGKTAFVRGFVRGMGSDKPVSSPTFSLMNEYQGGRLPVYHFDLYRINGQEAIRLGFDELFEAPGVVSVVEWCERLVEEQLPYPRIEITFCVLSEMGRSIEITPIGMELTI